MDLSRTARTLRDLVEPLAAAVYFSPEAQSRYGELGLSYLPGYFCSRGGCLGKVPGQVIASAFAVFEPDMVVRSVEEGWSRTDPEAVLAARLAGATEQLGRILGDPDDDIRRATEVLRSLTDGLPVAGRAIFAGLTSLPWPGDDGWGDFWRAADLVREHRGDAHVAAWIAHVDPVEITLMTELWWGIGLGTYVRTRGFDDDAIAGGIASLEARGLVADGEFTPEGEELRAFIEHETDVAESEVVRRLGGGAADLFAMLEHWKDAVVADGAYPVDPATLTRHS
jgi:hypothetical protein